MATSRSLLCSHSLHAFHAEGGVDLPAHPSPSSFRIHSSLQSCLHTVALDWSTPPRMWSPRLLSSLRGFRGNRPRRFLLFLAKQHGNIDVVRSLSPHRTNWNCHTMRRPICFERRAISEENAADVAMKDNSDFLPPGWPTVALALFGLGFLLGPPLDGIHSRVGLQVYDNGAIDLFGLKTSIWVPPLLGVFYSLAGLLSLVLDKKLARKGNIPTANLTKVAASFLSLAVLLELSAELYHAGVPANIEGYTLFFCAQLSWVLLDNTWWGFALASLIGVICPLAEIPIVKTFGLWHYPQANVSLFGELSGGHMKSAESDRISSVKYFAILGFVTWVICCYFFYTPFISNLSRWLVSYQKGLEEPKQ